MSRALAVAIVLVSFVIGAEGSPASEVGGEEAPRVAPAIALDAPTPAPAAWIAPAPYRSGAPYWRSWRSASPGTPRHWPDPERRSIADEAARKAYWRGWYDHRRSATVHADTVYADRWRPARPAYPAYRDWSSLYQQRRSIYAGNLAYRGR